MKVESEQKTINKKRYDDFKFTGRSIKVHRDWLASLSCDIIEINSEDAVAYTIFKILEKF